MKVVALLAVTALGLGLGGCKDAETRAREAEERIRAQLKDPMAEALAQELPAATVKEAQEHLRVLQEYHDPPDGVLDMVTVNAIQAFQDAHGLEANGMLTEETLTELRAEAAKRKS